MTKRKRCPICEKLFAPQGFKKHINWCLKQQSPPAPFQVVTQDPHTFEGESITKQREDDEAARTEQDKRLSPTPAQNVHTQDDPPRTVDMAALTPDAIATRMADFSPGKIYPSASTFESIVKELKAANLGFVVITLE